MVFCVAYQWGFFSKLSEVWNMNLRKQKRTMKLLMVQP